MSTQPAVAQEQSPAQVEPVPFGPGDRMWDEMGDAFAVSLWGAAFMLQAMHPTISAAVDHHSVFRTDPLGRAVRSADSVMLWVYGGAEAIVEGRRLRELHKPIRGRDRDGTPYSALNPEAYAWVHGTSFVTTVATYPLIHGREMTEAEQVDYYREVLQLGDILQIPRRLMPPDPAAYWDYYHEMVATRLARSIVAEDLLRSFAAPDFSILPGPLDRLAWPGKRALGHFLYLSTIGGMTPDAREVLGVRWTSLHDAQLRAFAAAARPVHRRLPEPLRYLPIALHARRRARSIDAIKQRSSTSLV
ncbi:MAG TPA: oxygenase MpaB family protein [Solirubrobacteraceae bacterium]|jgi:uncharacterized protein (DUF2236 family)|nr:oxygenase MpaB family protein [Solirubrobacteraceae bacterium]